MMKQFKILSIIALSLCFVVISCNNEDERKGEGMLKLNVGYDSQTITVETKAADTETEKCKVVIKNALGEIVRKYDDAKEIPSELWLLAGDYSVTATLGTPKKAEFNHPCYEGENSFTMRPNQMMRQEVVCKLVQSKVTVVPSDNVKKNFADYKTTVAMGTNKLVFPKDTIVAGYFYSDDAQASLVCQVEAKAINGLEINKEVKIENIKPRTHYKLNLDYMPTYEDGGFKVEIEVNEDATEVDDNIGISLKKYPAVVAQSDYFYFQKPGESDLLEVIAKGYPEFKSLVLSSSFFESRFPGLPANFNSFDVKQLSESDLSYMKGLGFTFDFTTVDASDKDNLKHEEIKIGIPIDMNISCRKTDFIITATDSYGKVRTYRSSITISGTQVQTEPIEAYDVWSNFATLRGTWLDEKPATIGFNYRIEGNDQWKTVPMEELKIDEASKSFTAVIKNLTPGETYEYQATEVDGKADEAQRFTTETAFQIPNMDFDDWCKSGKAYYPALDLTDANHWWDTANGGTSLMEVNPTLPEKSDVHTKGDGKRAAKLTSSEVDAIITKKFAAGNLYTGRFGKIVGIGADLYFGQPYTDRPTQLKGWFKYNPGPVTHNPDGYLDGHTNDIASIYIALCSWSDRHYFNTTDVKGTSIDFSKKNPAIIAYGEVLESELSKPMSEYKQFVIDLKYRNLKKKPTHILIVATASKYGDYFTGGESSELLLDDFELVFGDNPTMEN